MPKPPNLGRYFGPKAFFAKSAGPKYRPSGTKRVKFRWFFVLGQIKKYLCFLSPDRLWSFFRKLPTLIFFFFDLSKDLSTYRPYHFFPCYRKHVYFFFFFPITLWHEVVYCLLIAYTGTMPKCFAIVCRVAESHPTYVTGASFSMHTHMSLVAK